MSDVNIRFKLPPTEPVEINERNVLKIRSLLRDIIEEPISPSMSEWLFHAFPMLENYLKYCQNINVTFDEMIELDNIIRSSNSLTFSNFPAIRHFIVQDIDKIKIAKRLTKLSVDYSHDIIDHIYIINYLRDVNRPTIINDLLTLIIHHEKLFNKLDCGNIMNESITIPNILMDKHPYHPISSYINQYEKLI